jgi:xanthine dehydrogenase accessory factor
MRKLNQLIVLVRGGDETGSAVAHRLFCSHFRVCVTEVAQPLSICRGAAYSEAVYETLKTIEGVTAERCLPTVENVYRLWREGKIPLVVDPEVNVRGMLRPDVLVNALMLKRTSNIKTSDAPLVIGIGPGFLAGQNVHMVIETKNGINLGKVLFDGASEDGDSENSEEGYGETQIYCADEAGVFITDREIGEVVSQGDEVGRLGEEIIVAPLSGVIRGLLRSEMRVLPKTRLIEIDPLNGESSCHEMREEMRAISGGVLEAIMRGCNVDDVS